MSDGEITVVLGVGPGLGGAIARRFAKEGHTVALMARGEDKLEPVREAIERAGGQALGVPCDATDPDSVGQAFATVRRELGDPDVLAYNAGAFRICGVVDTDPETFEQCWKANCYGAFLALRETLPSMEQRGRGTVLLTGATASLRGGASFSCLAVGKFGLRALAQSTAREYGPKGIHVAHVIIDGQIDIPRMREMFPGREDHTFLQPDAIADSYWHLHQQDPRSWTLEMDLRPAVEKF